MTETRVWFGDQESLTWDATADGAAIDFTGATVVWVASPLNGGDDLELPCTATTGAVTLDLDGALPIGGYDLVVRGVRGGKTITYPSAELGPVRLVVRARLG